MPVPRARRVVRLDPASIAVACGVLIAAAVLAAYVPARRASAIDPLTALRSSWLSARRRRAAGAEHLTTPSARGTA
jgi:hypothetical protein